METQARQHRPGTKAARIGDFDTRVVSIVATGGIGESHGKPRKPREARLPCQASRLGMMLEQAFLGRRASLIVAAKGQGLRWLFSSLFGRLFVRASTRQDACRLVTVPWSPCPGRHALVAHFAALPPRCELYRPLHLDV